MTPWVAWSLLALVWITTSLLGGAVLATLARRIHPELIWRRLWLVYSALLAFAVAAVLAIGWC